MSVGGSYGPLTFCANCISMKHYSILALTLLSLAAAGCKSDEPEKNIDDIIDIGPGTTTEHPILCRRLARNHECYQCICISTAYSGH